MRSDGSTDGQNAGGERSCPIFGVESGIPVIGLGALLILFVTVPILAGQADIVPLPVAFVTVGFGVLLVWLGLKK